MFLQALRLGLSKWLMGSEYEIVPSADWYHVRGKLLSGNSDIPELNVPQFSEDVRDRDKQARLEKAAKRIFDVLKRDTTATGPMFGIQDLADRASCDINVAYDAIAYLTETCPDVIFESDPLRTQFRMRIRSSQDKVISTITNSKVLGGQV